MDRPEIELVIPIQYETPKLEKTVKLLEQNTKNYKLTIVKAPDLNVSEARASVMKHDSDLICFLDDDSELITPDWLDKMYDVLQVNHNAAVVFGNEWWDEEPCPKVTGQKIISPRGYPIEPMKEVPYGPAACMLIDKTKLKPEVQWDKYIGLRSGWLGGDMEEVDYCFKINQLTCSTLVVALNAVFHHTGGKGTFKNFWSTDRSKSAHLMKHLIQRKYGTMHTNDNEFFKSLKYIKARDDNDLYVASGQKLKDAYYDLLKEHGMLNDNLVKSLIGD